MSSKLSCFAFCVVIAVPWIAPGSRALSQPVRESQADGQARAGRAAGVKDADLESAFAALFADHLKRVARTPSRTDDAELAATMLEAAETLVRKPELRTYIYAKACEFGMKDVAGHESAAVAIGKLLASASPERSVELNKTLLTARQAQLKAADLLSRPAATVALVEQLVAVGDACVRTDEAAHAGPFYRQALGIAQAQRIGGPLTENIVVKLEASDAIRAAGPSRKRLTDALKGDPSDAGSRGLLVELYLISHDSPAEAAGLLTGAVDETLRGNVMLANRPVDKADEVQCLQLGQWYGALSRKAPYAARPLVLRRAIGWYEAYHARQTASDADWDKTLKGLQRLRTQLDAAENRLRKPPPPLRLKLPRTVRESLVFKGHTSKLRDLAVSTDCSLVVSASADGTVRFWELAAAKELRRLKWGDEGHPDNVWFSPDATKLLVEGGTKQGPAWRVYDIASGKVLGLPGAKGAGRSAGFHPDGKSILIWDNNMVKAWSYEQAKDMWQVSGKYVTHSRDGGLLITNSKEGLLLWNARTGKELRKFGFGDVGAEFSPDGKSLLFKRPAGPAMYDAESGRELWKGNVPAALCGGFSPDSRTVLYLGETVLKGRKKHTAFLFDARTGKPTGQFPVGLYAGVHGRRAGLVAEGDCVLIAGGHMSYQMIFYSRRTGKEAFKRHYNHEPYCTVGPGHLLVPSDKAGTPNVFSLYGLR